MEVAALFLLSAVANFAHYWAFYEICTGTAIAAGVNKAVQCAWAGDLNRAEKIKLVNSPIV